MDQLTAESDLDLLQRFTRDKDEAAFAAITQRYGGIVFAACHRVLRDRGRAEEIVQETFFRLTKNPQAGTVSLAGWLHRTATQLAIDTLRSDATRRKRETDYAARPPAEASTWAEISPLVDEALQSMPQENRDLLAEHFLAGKTQAELAEQLNVSPATLSRRIHCALEQLRATLRDRGVIVAPTLLTGFLACGLTAGTISTTLSGELGKIAMVSSLAHGWVLPTSAARAAGVLAFAAVSNLGRSASAAAWSAAASSALVTGTLHHDTTWKLFDETFAARWTTSTLDLSSLTTRLDGCLNLNTHLLESVRLPWSGSIM